ncbi:hypothetical protein [Aquimarina intermedia]|uniref:Uncharacterized protein n=1 Tax=Aquimarina intermedia TaxID=350814 RepID=A0A5S5BYY2_9FLAO|nr:hypothetical protein [Aquimarina intermedia]TYP71558.1 hypothetical protein BD809_109140 [Aquimarina intermedia]
MRKILFILIIAFFILSCDSNKKIEGTWISAYTFSKESNQPVGFPFRQIINFENNNIQVREFKYDLTSEGLLIGSYKYTLDQLTYNINNVSSKIGLIYSKDSLIFKNFSGTSNIYKKIGDNLKSKTEKKLVNKSFLYHTKNYNDTIHFLNDSILTYSNGKPKKYLRWERFIFNDFDILFTENDIPYIISKFKNSILLTGFHQKKHEIELIEIE